MRLPAFLKSRLPDLFGIDLRTLALFRVALASVTAFDLLQRLGNVRAFYTDFGLMPRGWLTETLGSGRLSLHLVNGDTWFQFLLITAQAVLALMVLVGHRTRLATVLTFVLLGSLHNRNPLILTGADNLMMCLWFWAMFLPLSARWSMDAALSPRPPPQDNLHLSWASAGLLLQVLYVYFFSAALKSGADWWPDGTAVYYALSVDYFATPFGVWLRELPLPWLMPALTYYVYFLEWVGPVLALSPWLLRPLRFGVMLALMLMHIGFALCLAIGHFPFVSLAGLAVLLGGWWWDRAARRADHGRGIHIYYDRDCGFCLKMCRLFQHLLVLPRCEILPAQDYGRARALMEAHYTWVVIDADDVAHTKWRAYVALLRHSLLFGWSARFAGLKLWERPGEWAYDFVARHRDAFGRLTAMLLPEREARFETGRFAQGFAAVFVLVVLAWNLASVRALPSGVSAMFSPAVRALRLDQTWNMFAPRPTRDDGWMLAPGRLEDGRELDVLRPDAALSYAKPRHISVTHETPSRWRKLHTRLWLSRYARHREPYARYLCRDWNIRASPGQRLLSLKLVWMLERTPPPGVTPVIEQRVLWRHDCVSPPEPAPEPADVSD